MNPRLTWSELSALKVGACVAFAEPERVFGTREQITVETGTVCTIEENGLNEIWGGIIVRPVDAELQRRLVFHQEDYNGCIMLAGPNDGCPSPFVLDDSCPVECI